MHEDSTEVLNSTGQHRKTPDSIDGFGEISNRCQSLPRYLIDAYNFDDYFRKKTTSEISQNTKLNVNSGEAETEFTAQNLRKSSSVNNKDPNLNSSKNESQFETEPSSLILHEVMGSNIFNNEFILQGNHLVDNSNLYLTEDSLRNSMPQKFQNPQSNSTFHHSGKTKEIHTSPNRIQVELFNDSMEIESNNSPRSCRDLAEEEGIYLTKKLRLFRSPRLRHFASNTSNVIDSQSYVTQSLQEGETIEDKQNSHMDFSAAIAQSIQKDVTIKEKVSRYFQTNSSDDVTQSIQDDGTIEKTITTNIQVNSSKAVTEDETIEEMVIQSFQMHTSEAATLLMEENITIEETEESQDFRMNTSAAGETGSQYFQTNSSEALTQSIQGDATIGYKVTQDFPMNTSETVAHSIQEDVILKETVTLNIQSEAGTEDETMKETLIQDFQMNTNESATLLIEKNATIEETVIVAQSMEENATIGKKVAQDFQMNNNEAVKQSMQEDGITDETVTENFQMDSIFDKKDKKTDKNEAPAPSSNDSIGFQSNDPSSSVNDNEENNEFLSLDDYIKSLEFKFPDIHIGNVEQAIKSFYDHLGACLQSFARLRITDREKLYDEDETAPHKPPVEKSLDIEDRSLLDAVKFISKKNIWFDDQTNIEIKPKRLLQDRATQTDIKQPKINPPKSITTRAAKKAKILSIDSDYNSGGSENYKIENSQTRENQESIPNAMSEDLFSDDGVLSINTINPVRGSSQHTMPISETISLTQSIASKPCLELEADISQVEDSQIHCSNCVKTPVKRKPRRGRKPKGGSKTIESSVSQISLESKIPLLEQNCLSQNLATKSLIDDEASLSQRVQQSNAKIGELHVSADSIISRAVPSTSRCTNCMESPTKKKPRNIRNLKTDSNQNADSDILQMAFHDFDINFYRK